MERLNEIREWVIQTQLQYDQTLEIMEYTDESKTEIHVKMVKPYLTWFNRKVTEVAEGNIKTDFALKVMNDYKNNPKNQYFQCFHWNLPLLKNSKLETESKI